MLNSTINNFPIGYAQKTIETTYNKKNILLYFNDGKESDKRAGNELFEQRKSKYMKQLNIGPNAPIDKIKAALVIKPEDNTELGIHISGHSMACDFKNLEPIKLNDRKIGGKSLDDIYEIITYILNIMKSKKVKIKLHSCETGVIPDHAIYEQFEVVEKKYHAAKSSIISQAKITLPENPEYNELSSAEYIARKLKLAKYSNIEVSGVNGILLSNAGKTDAVISRDIYSKSESYETRKKVFCLLKEAIESKNLAAVSNASKNLMHIRKVKVLI